MDDNEGMAETDMMMQSSKEMEQTDKNKKTMKKQKQKQQNKKQRKRKGCVYTHLVFSFCIFFFTTHTPSLSFTLPHSFPFIHPFFVQHGIAAKTTKVNMSSPAKAKAKDKAKAKAKAKTSYKKKWPQKPVGSLSVQHKHGWHFVRIEGSPYDRGMQYGRACASDFAQVQAMLAFRIWDTYGVTWVDMIRALVDDFGPTWQTNYPEQYQEMSGIAAGCMAANVPTTVDEIMAWNLYITLAYWWPTSALAATLSSSSASSSSSPSTQEGGKGTEGSADRCSAFLAVGPDWTLHGDIVCAHNSFADFVDGQYSNYVVSVFPDQGHAFVMQTSPGWIWSGTDFFVTAAGIVGTETTFGGFVGFVQKDPVCCRIRQVMQYATTLDACCSFLCNNNAGDYANAWLFGHIHTREILRLELGLRFHNIERTTNGYFIGFNAPYDPRIRAHETVHSGFDDIRRHQGARKVRLEEWVHKHKGRWTVALARRLLADHYDVYLRQANHPCSRTVCAHYDLDAREYMSQADRPKPFAPHGTVDGMVCDSAMIGRMQMQGRFGNSCGMPFSASAYIRKHAQYARWKPYLHDRPSQPWAWMDAERGLLSQRIQIQGSLGQRTYGSPQRPPSLE